MSETVLLVQKRESELPSISSLFRRRCVANLIDSAVVGAIATVLCAVIYQDFPANPLLHSMHFAAWLTCAFAIGFLDSFLACGLFLVVATVAYFVLWILLGMHELSSGFSALISHEGFPLFLWLAAHIVANWLYHAHFQSSSSKFSPGMRAMKLKITNVKGQQISFLRASLRHAAKSLTLLATLLPISHVLFGNRMQLIHDRITRSYVFPDGKLEVPEIETPASLLKLIEDSHELPSIESDQVLTSHKVEYASLPSRVGSALLDALLFYSLVYPLFVSYEILLCENAWKLCSDRATLAYLLSGFYVCGYVISTVFVSLLLAFMEGSRLQSTPGKIVLGLRVVNHSGARINLLQAIAKQMVQALVYTSLVPIVWIPAIFLMFKFGVSSTNAPLYVLAPALLFYLAYGILLCVTLIKGRQTIVDRLSQRYVVVDRKRSLVIE